MKTRVWLLVVAAVGSAAAMAAMACSSDSSSTPAADSDAGPEASAADAGTEAGEPVDTGVIVTDAGTPDAGQCANEELVGADGGYRPSCASCLAASCCAQVKNCEANPDCAAFARCYAECKLESPDASLSACQSKCIVGRDASALQSTYNPLTLCGGSSCHNDGDAGAPQCPF
ncbi:MAG: hypothetical protein U0235_11570 [Polyangiaceae bacterium]